VIGTTRTETGRSVALTTAASDVYQDGVHARTPSNWLLALVLSAIFMAQFDFFVVNVAAPSLQRDLYTGDGALELVVGGYAFAYASGLITGGRLGDMFGYRRLFLAGMLSFVVTSALCGMAASPAELVAARIAQGLAAAAMLPQVLALITAMYPPEERPRAIAWYAVSAGIGSVAGQVLGGLMVSANVADLGWRSIFLVNVPIGILAFGLTWRMLPDRQRPPGSHLDLIGAAGIAGSLALVLAPLSLGRAAGWPVWTWICMLSAAPLAYATVTWERLLERRGTTPALQLSLLRSTSFRNGMLASAAFMLYYGSFMFTLTLLLQAGLSLDPFQAGLAFAPAGVAFSVSSLAARRLVARWGMRAVVLACLVSATALALLIADVNREGPTANLALVVTCAGFISLGNGVVSPSLIGAALVDVKAVNAGAASGLLITAQQFASSAGVALVGTAFFAVQQTIEGVSGYTRGMSWSGGIDLVLVAIVAALLMFVGGRRPAPGFNRR
jgi:MFS family permease